MKNIHVVITCNHCKMPLMELTTNEVLVNHLLQTLTGFLSLQHGPAHSVYPNIKASLNVEAAELPTVEKATTPGLIKHLN